MRIAIGLILAAASFSASAYCTGSGAFRQCSDASGNSYNVQQLGNTTYVQGYNAQTGSSWNQTSQNVGNTTYHHGTAANGNSWNGTTQHIGNTTYHNGINSQGQPYARTCNQFGCN